MGAGLGLKGERLGFILIENPEIRNNLGFNQKHSQGANHLKPQKSETPKTAGDKGSTESHTERTGKTSTMRTPPPGYTGKTATQTVSRVRGDGRQITVRKKLQENHTCVAQAKARQSYSV